MCGQFRTLIPERLQNLDSRSMIDAIFLDMYEQLSELYVSFGRMMQTYSIASHICHMLRQNIANNVDVQAAFFLSFFEIT